MLDSLSLKSEQELEVSRRRKPRLGAEELFEAHFEAVYRYLARRTSVAEDAQDLAAETFAATVGRQAPRNVEPLSWLYGIARRKLADHLRKRRNIPITPLQPIDATASERGAILRKIIDRLPAAQREALLLQALEDLSVRQIGQVMGRSDKSVKALLQRAKDRVRSEGRAEFEQEENLWI